MERVLGRNYAQNGKEESKEKADCCYDVPLIESLQRLLNCSTVHEQASLLV